MKYGDTAPLMADKRNYSPPTDVDDDAAMEETKEQPVADIAAASTFVTPARRPASTEVRRQ